MWHWPIGLEQSAGLDAGGGVQGCQVCQVRTSKQEDEAGASQVMVEHGHMLFLRLQHKQPLHCSLQGSLREISTQIKPVTVRAIVTAIAGSTPVRRSTINN